MSNPQESNRWQELIAKYLAKTITREELDNMLQWADREEKPDQLETALRTHWEEVEAAGLVTDRDWTAKLEALLEEARAAKPAVPAHRVHFLRRYGWIAAAVLLFAVATTYILLLQQDKKQAAGLATHTGKHDVAPGHNGALLKLSNGRIIAVDTAKDGLIATDGKVQVFKRNGKIEYKGMTDEHLYNEIITDKGRQWTAALPDGTIASLNAGSSLRYPLHFTGKERLVEMTGEAYFEVVHNEFMPFRVKVKGQVVEDIGTVFNINAYGDEMFTKTTLVEGMASVTQGTSKVTLKAGQQASVYDNAASIKVSPVDASRETAWVRGLFSFSHSDIPSIMRQLVRWYNVEVEYPAGVPDETFTGEMNRTLTLSEALDVMKDIGIHYRIEEGRRIEILP